MQESGFEWPLLSETEQERELERTVGAILLSEELTYPVARELFAALYPTVLF
jgi:hypothetical protein